jgi:hypothetical protein
LKADVAPAPPLAPNEFQSRLRQATLAAEERARTNNVKLPDRFQLGFDEFARTMPSTAVAALLGQELSQVQMFINILLDAKVDSITAFRRRPLPEERGASPTPTPSLGQRVATTAKPGGTPEPLTPPGSRFYADCSIDVSRQRLVCVREDHTATEHEAVTTLAARST